MPVTYSRSRTYILLLLGSLLLVACAGTPTYNPTTFPFEFNQEKFAAADIKTVVIPHVNLGTPSRNYLESEAPRIDGFVSTYLKENGYRVIKQREFKQLWSAGVRAYGDPVDPTTGKVNMKSFAQIMTSIRDEMVEKHDLDAFVFTDLVELETSFSGGLKHLARWDGVTRKPSLQGPGSGVSVDFDWNAPAAVASLQVSVFNADLERVFFSRGGIDATEAIDTRSASGRFTRRRTMLENEDYIMEGVQLAFHPMITMEAWPGNP
ncbi:hypothetical protein DWB85_12330 [Seongchinamella sediminis]|uniref:Uncharacterized protein n=1 Tax=Seongchinamella sediminis TaxID=2283635 RepID=A0A3L7DVE4_9GAMM|nr:hypothetical protein [Seongchinamella sediminis]RLQ21538.1 hypothetical protein DWB85_12330 [Seongchinamella sediminis]